MNPYSTVDTHLKISSSILIDGESSQFTVNNVNVYNPTEIVDPMDCGLNLAISVADDAEFSWFLLVVN